MATYHCLCIAVACPQLACAAGTARQRMLMQKQSRWPPGIPTDHGLQGETAADQDCGNDESNTQQVLQLVAASRDWR